MEDIYKDDNKFRQMTESMSVDISFKSSDIGLSIPGGVQLYLVFQDKHVVSLTTASTSLVIIEPDLNSNGSDCFIKIENFLFQLTKEKSPVLKCINGLYVFSISNEVSETKNSIGIVLSQDLHTTYRTKFEEYLKKYSLFEIQESRLTDEPVVNMSETVPYTEEDEISKSQKISDTIIYAADLISSGVTKTARYTKSAIGYGAQKLKSSLQESQDSTNVNPDIETGLRYASKAADITSKGTAFLVSGLSYLTQKGAEKLGPHVSDLANRTFPNDSKEKVHGFSLVAHSSMRGLGSIWKSVEEAGSTIAHAASHAAVETVQHKFGQNAADATSLVTSTMINIGNSYHNISNLGFKAIIMRFGKDSGKEALQNYVENQQQID